MLCVIQERSTTIKKGSTSTFVDKLCGKSIWTLTIKYGHSHNPHVQLRSQSCH